METQELAKRLNDADIKVLDATFHIPPSPRQAQSEFLETRIPGARFFDIDAIADHTVDLPHMLPKPEAFEAAMQSLGIQNSDTVVVYDVHGILSAPRVWWTFRYFGHERVYVLNGGLPKWLSEHRPIESGQPEPASSPEKTFKARVQPELCVDSRVIQDSLKPNDANLSANTGPAFQIVDMRSAGRFNALEPEPRVGLRSGHIPQSVNVPWAAWLNSDKTLLSQDQLLLKCEEVGLNPKNSTVMTCGSGVTACVGALAFYELGNPDVMVYDGAWAEWGSRSDLPIAP